MNCPKCNIPLSMSDRQGVEIDFCPQCRGVWLDRGELDKIIERSSFTAPPVSPAGAPPPMPTASHMPPQQPNYRRHDDDDDDDYRRRSYDKDYDKGYDGKKKKKGFLGDLFDF